MPYAEQLTGDLTHHRHTVETMEKHFSDLLKKTDSVMLDLLKLQEENKKLKQQNEELQEKNKKLKQEGEEFYDTKNSLEERIEELQEEVEERTTYAVLPEEGKFMDENEKLKEQIDELGTLCMNIDDNAYNTWKEITNRK